MTATKTIDHTLTDEIVCPFCGYEHSDSIDFGEYGENEPCNECGEKFNFICIVTVEYTTRKAVE